MNYLFLVLSCKNYCEESYKVLFYLIPPAFACTLIRHSYNAVLNAVQVKRNCNIQAVLGFQTFDLRTSRNFILYKFSPIIHVSYAKFRLLYTADEQTFQALTDWHCKTEFQTVFCVYWMPQSSSPLGSWSKAWACGHSLVGTVGSNPARDMDVCLLWVLFVVR